MDKTNLFIGAGTIKVFEYSIPTGTMTATVKVPGVFDVAPGLPATVVPAVNLYATGEASQLLQEVNMTTGVVTVLANLTNRPDNTILDSQGRLLYTTGGSGTNTVSRYDPNAKTVSVVMTGLSYPRDLISIRDKPASWFPTSASARFFALTSPPAPSQPC